MTMIPFKMLLALQLAVFSQNAIGGVLSSTRATGQQDQSVATNWRFNKRQHVDTITTKYAPIVYYIPKHPKHILVLVFGYPWDDASDATILSYAQSNVRKWATFAERDDVLLVAPVLGGFNFVDYRELRGRLIAPDHFVDATIDGPARRAMPGFDGKFCIHGHSAGAQFASRYVVAHPDRLECAILSAPSTYAMPTEAVRWPFGMGQANNKSKEAPSAASWMAAATRIPVDVIVGSKDIQKRPDAPGQTGATRLARGRAWVAGMQALASRNRLASSVHFTIIRGLAHDEDKMAVAAQRLLHDRYSGAHSPDHS